jgi:hypothetical protein
VQVERFFVILAGVILAAVVAAATSVHLPVSTNSADAQAAIDRGLFLYYAYNGDDAAHAFAQAAALDSHLAMAYWGVALADGPDLNTPIASDRFDRAAEMVRRAVALSGGLPAREASFIAILARRYRGSFAAWARDDAAYREAMLQFARESQDENAELLAAEALLEGGGLTWQAGAPVSEASRDALQLVMTVLRDDPANPMANHLCVHLYDLAPDRTPALPCAQRLDAAAFLAQAEHLAHMPAHYWIETGNYSAALASSDRAYALIAQLDDGPSQLQHARRYAKHDVAVGYSAAMMLGSYAVARLWSQRMATVFDESFDALTALRFGRFSTAYAAEGGQFGGPSVRGLAALHLGHTSAAHAIATQIDAGNSTGGYLPQLFLARLAETDGKLDESKRWIARALHNQRTDFSGELIPLIPAAEALGGLHLRRGDNAAAAAAFADALATYPNDPRALYGLSAALAAQGQLAQAAAARAHFEMEWKGADTSASDALP